MPAAPYDLMVSPTSNAPAPRALIGCRNGSVEAVSHDGSVMLIGSTVRHVRPTALSARQAAREKLREFQALADGWGPDGDGQPLTPIAYKLAGELLDALPTELVTPALDVIPSTDGGVQLEWGHGEREVDVFIGPRGSRYNVYVRGGRRLGFEGTLTVPHVRRVEEEVRWALGS